MNTKLPKALKKNSTIGLVCPAGGFVDYKPINQVVKYLKALGYKVRLGKSLVCSGKAYKYLSARDPERLKDIHDFFKDKNIDAVFCLRGGYGSLRLLNNIDFELIKRNKKILLGFSDITVLLLAIFAKCNFITFHGPLLGIGFLNKHLKAKDKDSENYMWKMLHDNDFKFSYCSNGKIIHRGKTSGLLLGGNLTDICSMLGSDYLPDFKNSILFLEDVYEEPYKIDRLLTQLENAQIFKKVQGILFCSFENCKFKNNNEVIKLLKDRISKYKIPSIYNFSIGHGKKNYVVPIGQKVVLDANNAALYSA